MRDIVTWRQRGYITQDLLIELLAELPELKLEPLEQLNEARFSRTKAWQLDGRNRQTAELAHHHGVVTGGELFRAAILRGRFQGQIMRAAESAMRPHPAHRRESYAAP